MKTEHFKVKIIDQLGFIHLLMFVCLHAALFRLARDWLKGYICENRN